MRPTILLTGATGAFGRHVFRELVRRRLNVAVMIRARTTPDAEARVRRAIDDCDLRRVAVLRGDLAAPRLGLSGRDYRSLSRTVDAVLHAAASTEFNLPLDAARLRNVETTRNVLTFAERAGCVSSFGYVSTAFVAGRRTGLIHEDELPHDAGFVNSYEQSKYETEELVRVSQGECSTVIFRPSVIVDSDPRTPSGVRFVLRLIQRGALPMLPAVADSTLDVISARDAASAMVDLFLGGGRGVFHVGSGRSAPTVLALAQAAGGSALVGPERFRHALPALAAVRPELRTAYAELSSFIYVLAYPKVFDTTRTEELLGRSSSSEDPLLILRRLLRETRQSDARAESRRAPSSEPAASMRNV